MKSLFMQFALLWTCCARAASTFVVTADSTKEVSADCYDTFVCAGGSTVKFTSASPESKGEHVFWDHGDLRQFHPSRNRMAPGDSFVTRPVAFTLRRALKEPVWVDLMTGRVYEFPQRNVRPTGRADCAIYKMVPVYDSPCLLTERAVVLP